MNEKAQIVSKRIFGLDFIRAISILLVLFSHSSWIYNSQGFLGKIQDFSGFIGVELFLVLSGFLVGGIIFKHFTSQEYTIQSVIVFLERRLFRVLPNYYLAIVINCIIFLSLGLSIVHVWQYFFLIQNIATPMPEFFPETWSLPIKELGYIVLVFLLLIFSQFINPKFKEILFLSVVIGLLIVSLVSKIIYNLNSNNTDLFLWSLEIRSVVIYRIDTVMMGILMGYLFFKFPDKLLKNKLFLLVISVIFFLILFAVIHVLKYRLDNGGKWFWNIVCLPFIGVIISFLLPFFLNWKTAPELLQNVIIKICNWSYSIYLVHYSIVLFLIKTFIDTDSLTFTQKHFVSLLYVTVAFLLGFLIYQFFEKPINDYRTKKFILNGRK